MNRCVPAAASLGACLTLGIGLALTPTLVAAQAARPFPADALRGELVVVQPPEVLLNGRPARLSPGARIRGENNMLQMSGALVGVKLKVHYTVEPAGNLHNVWILTPAELARQPWPTSADEARRWQFDAASQSWTKR